MRNIKATAEAYQKFAQALSDLAACKELFESAGVPLPEQLRELLGTDLGNGKPAAMTILPPRRANRPADAGDDWISVELSEVTATSLVLAVLRAANAPVKAGDVIHLVTSLNPNVTRGVIHNIGTRLNGRLIDRTEEGWSLKEASKAGLICDGYLWGPKDIFEKSEIAAHRREAILTILKGFQSGLQIVQLVEQLRGTKWVHSPASKDIVKTDIEYLEGHGKVRRISNSRKWVCVQTE